MQSLTGNQRKLLADMLHHERNGAIHDVLAALTWWLSCCNVGLTFCGEPMPFELSGMGLHGDYESQLVSRGWLVELTRLPLMKAISLLNPLRLCS